MQDGVGPMFKHHVSGRRGIVEIDPFKAVTLAVQPSGDRGEIAGIGQAIEVDYPVRAVAEQLPHHGTADKAGTAGDQQCFQVRLHWVVALFSLYIGLQGAAQDQITDNTGEQRPYYNANPVIEQHIGSLDFKRQGTNEQAHSKADTTECGGTI